MSPRPAEPARNPRPAFPVEAPTLASIGLTSEEAARRLLEVGPNRLEARVQRRAFQVYLAQLKSPLVLILVAAALISAALGEWVDALVIVVIVIGSAALTGWRELGAQTAIEKLRDRLVSRVRVRREGVAQWLPSWEVVPGDVVELAAGSLIPADGVLLEARDLHLDEAVLTGESFPVEKLAAPDGAAALEGRHRAFMGTSVASGLGVLLVSATGSATEYGGIAERLERRAPETEFERGLARFGVLLTQLMLVLILVVFAANVFDQKPAVEALLFAVALAVGISPELLPAILGIALSRGAQAMAAGGVIVRRLQSIENLGSMDVLCTDKTGTLTEGVLRLDDALDGDGETSPRVLELGFANATLQTGLPNPLDQAIRARGEEVGVAGGRWEKRDEVPYDFSRKRLSVLVERAGEVLLITKGAFEGVLACSTTENYRAQEVPLSELRRRTLQARYESWGEQGYRVLGLATRSLPNTDKVTREDERELCFRGFLLFFDPPKAGVRAALAALGERGVKVKIVSGDSQRVTQHVAAAVGMERREVLVGRELEALSQGALWHRVEQVDLFAEVDPAQKERILLALKRNGHVVGYLGDGINDAPALHAADVGISVEGAVDVAREAADLVLLRRDLEVLRQGIDEGRRTFANTLKYLYTTSSANFGNMVSMAVASTFLPFLPLLAKQILLNNFLSDIPAMALAGDRVDREWIVRPHRWDLRLIRNFMVVFGLVSSVFDLLTFALLAKVLQATPELFRTGWFVESLLTELAVALVVRTRLPMWKSRPSTLLWASSLGVALVAVALPYLPGRDLFGFVALPLPVLALLLGITLAYVMATEVTKRLFYRGVRA